MSLFNPYVLLGIVMAVLSAFGGGYWKGKDAEFQRQQLEIAALNAKARETERLMADVVTNQAINLRKVQNAAKIKEDKLRSDIADGNLKLRIPVKATNCPISTTTDSTIASGSDSGTSSAELDRSISEALIAITSEGDAAIRKLNTCIENYNSIYQTLKGTK